ncbi:TAPT1-like protein [Auxenochlorella protothecoides]|uniref:TAPT1-like protein n=1 Tax=Auxenochlorella protothecoides TaxID=3075 RepID=A0A087STH3_AUXPR|nr:TAPT1-like protein [Auxenochlorella protothecoides]KFM29027.1 TAPT1-like protein [Auxenochlorella protothecoides]RMZ54792.1 hypothetical protein APUTEX25_000309 [Auxenochlorella protothecoides]|eukprot:RMZ54792.1 hypothetical protein APUTEX25_000309 [Auxenochlorella protothecoides]
MRDAEGAQPLSPRVLGEDRATRSYILAPETSCPDVPALLEVSSEPGSPLARCNSEPELADLGHPFLTAAALPGLARTHTEVGSRMASLATGEARPTSLPPPRPTSAQSPRPAPSQPPEPPEVSLPTANTRTPSASTAFWAYVGSELRPASAQGLPDDVWGQTERDRVYNAILAVPYQLERFQMAGVLVCLDSFLSIFTLVPLRLALALGAGPLTGPQLYDLLLLGMFGCMMAFITSLNVGSIYYWLKDLTHEFLKLSVLYTALELSDKAMVFSVALNSKKNALVGLLIAANFGEIKGTVFKRFDAGKLYNLTCQDVVERFHLILILAFVVVEEMGNSGHAAPNAGLLAQCAEIFAAEAAIDVVKHAVLGKFNEIRPGVYREFMRDLSEGVGASASNSSHRLVGFEPFAAAALFLRISTTFLALRFPASPASVPGLPAALGRLALRALRIMPYWAVLMACKLLLGHGLRLAGRAYLRHYEATAVRPRGSARRNVSVLGHMGAHGSARKDD